EQPLPSCEAEDAVHLQQRARQRAADDRGDRNRHHEPRDRARALRGREPLPEVVRDAGKESRFSRTQQKPQQVEAPRALHEDRRGGNHAPADHDPREPHARADAIEDHVARDLEQAVAEEQNAGAVAELGRRQPELAVHRQRGEADVVPVEVVEDVREGEDGQQAPRDFLEHPLFAGVGLHPRTLYSAHMRFRATLAVFAAAVLAAVPALAQNTQRPQSDQEVLIRLERDWDVAFHHKDVPFIEKVLATEFVATYAEGQRADRATEIENAKNFNQQIDASELSEFIVKEYGDTAIVWFTQK